MDRLQLAFTGMLQCEDPRSFPMFYASGEYRGWRGCRRCEPCVACRIAEWALRARLEDCRWHARSFVTLTYAPEFIRYHEPDPETGEYLPSVCRRDRQLFAKRLRKAATKAGYPCVRIFGASEYGELHGRPHEHLAIWGLDGYSMVTRRLVEAAWTDPETGRLLGSTNVQGVRESLGAYVAKYALKQLEHCDLRGRERPRVMYPTRPGLGGDFADVFGAQFKSPEGRRLIAACLADVGRFRLNGKLTTLPGSLKLRARRAAGIDDAEHRYLRKQVHRWRLDEAIGCMGAAAWSEASSHVDSERIRQGKARRRIWESAR